MSLRCEAAQLSLKTAIKAGGKNTVLPRWSGRCQWDTDLDNAALWRNTKYGDTIYFRDGHSLYVNLFIASELKWKEKGVVVRQETRFPEEDITRVTLKCENPVRLILKFRYPSWAQSGITMKINGQKEPVHARPGSYVTVEREWKSGDTVQVRLPMNLRTEAMPDDPRMAAFGRPQSPGRVSGPGPTGSCPRVSLYSTVLGDFAPSSIGSPRLGRAPGSWLAPRAGGRVGVSILHDVGCSYWDAAADRCFGSLVAEIHQHFLIA